MKKYEKIYYEIREKILMNIYPEKTRIPSKRLMAERSGVSINTVEIAYLQLIEEGYIESKERSGYYVAELDYMTHVRGLGGNKKIDRSKGAHEYGDCHDKYVKCYKDTGKVNLPQKQIVKEDGEIKYQYNFFYGGVDPSFPFGIWKKINKEVVDFHQDELLTSGHGMGYEPLRESISNYLHETRSIVCSKDNILISSGTESLFEILFRLWKDDICFGLENPGFERWSSFLKANKVAYSCLKMDSEGIVLNDLEKYGIDVACVTPNHQFPTGKIMPIARRIKLLDWARDSSGWIIEDDYDGEFKYTGNRIPALKSMDDTDRVVYMGTFSNTISPSIRLSYMILPDELLDRYKERLSYMRCPVSTMTQIGIDIFIRKGYYHRHVNRMKKIYKAKRELILSTFESCDNIECKGSDAGLHMVVTFKNMDEEDIINYADKNGIKVRGLSDYYIEVSEEYEKDSVLIGFALMDIEDIKIAANILKNLIPAKKDDK